MSASSAAYGVQTSLLGTRWGSDLHSLSSRSSLELHTLPQAAQHDTNTAIAAKDIPAVLLVAAQALEAMAELRDILDRERARSKEQNRKLEDHDSE